MSASDDATGSYSGAEDDHSVLSDVGLVDAVQRKGRRGPGGEQRRLQVVR